MKASKYGKEQELWWRMAMLEGAAGQKTFFDITKEKRIIFDPFQRKKCSRCLLMSSPGVHRHPQDKTATSFFRWKRIYPEGHQEDTREVQVETMVKRSSGKELKRRRVKREEKEWKYGKNHPEDFPGKIFVTFTDSHLSFLFLDVCMKKMSFWPSLLTLGRWWSSEKRRRKDLRECHK